VRGRGGRRDALPGRSPCHHAAGFCTDSACLILCFPYSHVFFLPAVWSVFAFAEALAMLPDIFHTHLRSARPPFLPPPFFFPMRIRTLSSFPIQPYPPGLPPLRRPSSLFHPSSNTLLESTVPLLHLRYRTRVRTRRSSDCLFSPVPYPHTYASSLLLPPSPSMVPPCLLRPTVISPICRLHALIGGLFLLLPPYFARPCVFPRRSCLLYSTNCRKYGEIAW